jgi:hypothetical protein
MLLQLLSVLCILTFGISSLYKTIYWHINSAIKIKIYSSISSQTKVNLWNENHPYYLIVNTATLFFNGKIRWIWKRKRNQTSKIPIIFLFFRVLKLLKPILRKIILNSVISLIFILDLIHAGSKKFSSKEIETSKELGYDSPNDFL